MFVGQIVTAKVEKIFPTFLLTRVGEGYEGLLHVANMSDYYVSSVSSIFKIGNTYEFEVIEINDEKKWVKLSWKSIVPRFQKNPFEYVIQETPNGFKNLLNKTLEEVEND